MDGLQVVIVEFLPSVSTYLYLIVSVAFVLYFTAPRDCNIVFIIASF